MKHLSSKKCGSCGYLEAFSTMKASCLALNNHSDALLPYHVGL